MKKLSNTNIGTQVLYGKNYITITCIHCDGTGDDPYDRYPCGWCESLGYIPLSKVAEDTSDIIDLSVTDVDYGPFTEKPLDYKLIKPMFIIHYN